jgi:hypothetical protein
VFLSDLSFQEHQSILHTNTVYIPNHLNFEFRISNFEFQISRFRISKNFEKSLSRFPVSDFPNFRIFFENVSSLPLSSVSPAVFCLLSSAVLCLQLKMLSFGAIFWILDSGLGFFHFSVLKNHVSKCTSELEDAVWRCNETVDGDINS